MASILINLLLLLLLSVVVSTLGSSTPMITLEQIADGFDRPTAIVDANDGKKGMYIVERMGLIKKLKNSDISDFLDVSDRLGPCTGYCEERGLLGLVFHPNYSSNGYFYINYTNEDSLGILRTYVSRFSKLSGSNVGDASSEFVILEFEQPYSNHNAGDLQFGPDGYLYVTSGDGGSGGDPENNGQKTNTMLGKILRIDVDNIDTGKNYAVPADNPFVSDPSFLPEIWAYGLRNPWKISFDKKNGDLFIADVGQNQWEEVNYQPASSTGGENYGWRLMEGTHCYIPEVCTIDPSLTMPILEYEHVGGACSVTGGYVYRNGKNKRNKSLRGVYIYGDFCSGDFWGARKDENGEWSNTLIKESSGVFISTFGQNKRNGQVFVADYMTGAIYRVQRCWDNKNFFYIEPKRTCKFIGRRENRIKKFCKESEVYDNCKNTCSNPTC